MLATHGGAVHPPGQFAVAWYSLQALVSFAPGSWFFVRSWSFVLGALKKRATLQCGPWTRDLGRTTHQEPRTRDYKVYRPAPRPDRSRMAPAGSPCQSRRFAHSF